jgi:hypothetical protein
MSSRPRKAKKHERESFEEKKCSRTDWQRIEIIKDQEIDWGEQEL